MVSNLLTYLDNVKKANPTKQIVLLQDSLQTLDDGKYVDRTGESQGTTSRTPTACAKMLVEWAQENFGVVIFVGQCTKGGVFAGQNIIKHAIDIHANLFCDEKEKSDTYGCLLFEVQKNRWGCTGKTYILGLTKEGIEERGCFSKAGN